MKFRGIIEFCLDRGWEAKRITGGHLIMTKANRRSVPIPIHGEGIDIEIIKKELRHPPPTSSRNKSVKVVAIEKPFSDSVKIKNIKPKTVETGIETLLSNEEAAIKRQVDTEDMNFLFQDALENIFETENFVAAVKQLDILLQEYVYYMPPDLKSEIEYLFVISSFSALFGSHNFSNIEVESSMKRTLDLAKRVFTSEKEISSVLSQIIDSITLFHNTKSQIVFDSIVNETQSTDPNAIKQLINTLFNMLSWDIPVDYGRICSSGYMLSLELAGEGYNEYFDKAWDFLNILKRKERNFQEIKEEYGNMVQGLTRCVIGQFLDNKLAGSKYSQARNILKLINEAIRYPTFELILKVTRFYDYFGQQTNCDTEILLQLLEHIFSLVEEMKPEEEELMADYLECKIDTSCGNRHAVFQWAKYREIYEIWLRDTHAFRLVPKDANKQYLMPNAKRFKEKNAEYKLLHSQLYKLLQFSFEKFEKNIECLALDTNVKTICNEKLKNISEKARRKHSKLLVKALNDREKIKDLAIKTNYSKEEIQYGLEFYDMFLDLEEKTVSIHKKLK